MFTYCCNDFDKEFQNVKYFREKMFSNSFLFVSKVIVWKISNLFFFLNGACKQAVDRNIGFLLFHEIYSDSIFLKKFETHGKELSKRKIYNTDNRKRISRQPVHPYGKQRLQIKNILRKRGLTKHLWLLKGFSDSSKIEWKIILNSTHPTTKIMCWIRYFQKNFHILSRIIFTVLRSIIKLVPVLSLNLFSYF